MTVCVCVYVCVFTLDLLCGGMNCCLLSRCVSGVKGVIYSACDICVFGHRQLRNILFGDTYYMNQTDWRMFVFSVLGNNMEGANARYIGAWVDRDGYLEFSMCTCMYTLSL